MSVSHRVLAAALVATLVGAASAGAQQIVPLVDGAEAAALVAAPPGGGTRACRASAGNGHATIAAITSDTAGAPWQGGIPRAAWPALELFSAQVAAHVRARLGAPEGKLASPPDSLFRWTMLAGHVHVVAYKTGELRWWPAGGTPSHAARRDTTPTRGEALLLDAIAALQGTDGGFAWPTAVEDDSIAFQVRWAWPMPTGDSAMLAPIRAHHAAPVAPLLVPVVTGVEQLRAPRVGYPIGAQDAGVAATIKLEFVVDSTGRVVEESIRDVWDAPTPRPTGRVERFYRQFVRNARAGVLGAQYRPATVGGCVVPMPVRQYFVFEFAR